MDLSRLAVALPRPRRGLAITILVGAGTAALVAYATAAQEAALDEDGAWWMVGPWLVGAACQVAALLVLRDSRTPARIALVAMLGFGLAFRAVCVADDRIVNDDVHRYAWDGAVVAAGMDPYRFPPEVVLDRLDGGGFGPEVDTTDRIAIDALAQLAFATPERENHVRRVNYPTVPTIYPPLCQAAFAAAARLAADDGTFLAAWKAIVLGCELATLAAILAMLAALGRPWWWAVVYWWSPLPILELTLAAHSDALAAVTLAALGWALAANRHGVAGAALGAAILAKLWPAALVPLVLRRTGAPGAMGLAVALAVGLAPVAGSAVLDGARTFGREWTANAGAFAVLATVLTDPGARSVALATIAVAACGAARRPIRDGHDAIGRALTVALWIQLVAPVANPWYLAAWLPLACARPAWAPLVWTATVSLHYLEWRSPDARLAIGLVEYLPVWVLIAVARRDRDGAGRDRESAPSR